MVSELVQLDTSSSVQWKSEELLRVKGIVLKEGTYRDKNGKVTTLTRDSLSSIYDQIDGVVKLFLTHDHNDDPIGISYKFGLSEDGSELYHEGFIFEDVAEKMAFENFTSVSAEIDVISEDNTVVKNAKLVGIALTNSPAIEEAKIV